MTAPAAAAGRFKTFATLHVPGEPVVLFNIWDLQPKRSPPPGEALEGSLRGEAIGFGDATVSARFCLRQAKRIATRSTRLPLSVDSKALIRSICQGAAMSRGGGLARGCKFEDMLSEGNSSSGQGEAIASRRSGSPWAMPSSSTRGPTFTQTTEHDRRWSSGDRARQAFSDAGAIGFFVPRCPSHGRRRIVAKCAAAYVIAFPGPPEISSGQRLRRADQPRAIPHRD